MKPYAQLPTDNPEEYKRLVGLSKEDFQHLNSKLCVYIGPCLERKHRNPPRQKTSARGLLNFHKRKKKHCF
ncbi:hypothetical protein [Methylovulum psychrotolerans]|uniref:hypothetical protein n=1 Tax=Methylovulum psychrotolerans TaxID=1704499 RepID=UPI0012FA05F2|nr:hypothetical protein [Methylovulum psychrotolerans]